MTQPSVVIPPFLVGIGIVGLMCFVVTLWAIVHAVSTSRVDFVAAGTGKARWIAMIAILYFFTLFGGLVVATVYLTVIRRKLRDLDAPNLGSRS